MAILLAFGPGVAPSLAMTRQDPPPPDYESKNPLPPAIERKPGAGDDGTPPSTPSPDKKKSNPKEGTPRQPDPPSDGSSPPFPSLPAPPPDPAPLDPGVQRVQAPGADGKVSADPSPLPPAADKPGKPASSGTAPSSLDDGDARFLPELERLPIGPRTVGLTVHVISPPTMNLNKPSTLKILVKNPGPTEALGVVVYDVLPDNLSYVGSQPEAVRSDTLLTWKLGSVPAGAERTILVNVTPVKVGSFDHAATVRMMAGGRATTLVREPKLKVEQTVSASKVLKGHSVQFRISVSNPGDGPARNVTVSAKLSSGLRSDSGTPNEQNILEQRLDVINPGERVELDTLVADTLQGGEQSCVVLVQSPDVPKAGPELKNVKTISVIEPKLVLTLSGSEKRYTGTSATYEIKLKNPGSAPARNIRVVSTLPTGARMVKPPASARWDSQTRKLSWTRPLLEAGEETSLVFQVNLGGPGLYPFAAEARGEGGLYEKNTMNTDVLAVADVRLEVTESRRVVDVGDKTVLRILISNKGSKAATKIMVKAKLADTIEPTEIGGVDGGGHFDKRPGPDQRTCIFPLIDRLDPGKEIELGIRVQAVKAGTADCRVYLEHGDSTDDKLDDKLEDFVSFKVTEARR
jgi:uncharacterized repeat protein (TIGR01451 family)